MVLLKCCGGHVLRVLLLFVQLLFVVTSLQNCFTRAAMTLVEEHALETTCDTLAPGVFVEGCLGPERLRIVDSVRAPFHTSSARLPL